MRIPSFARLILLVLPLSFLFSGCTKDDQVAETPPTLGVSSVQPIDLNNILVSVGSTIQLKISGSKGSKSLQSLAIKEAGVLLPPIRLKQGGNPVSSNPVLVDATAFDLTFDLIAHADASKKVYDIILSDTNGVSTTKTIVITCLNAAPVLREPEEDVSVIRSPGSIVGTIFKVVKGTSDLKSITILLDGKVPSDLSGIFLGQLQTPVATNIITLSGNDTQGLNKELFIKTPTTIGTYVYTIRFQDTNGLEASRKIQITVGSPVISLTGILANAAGSSTVGGLDLDSGASTSILASNPTSSTAEIRDEGLVNPPADKTWRQQISGINGTEVKSLVPGTNGMPAGFTFESILYKEEISLLWAKGVNFTEKSADGARNISGKIKTGDLFLVKSPSKYYLMKTSEIKPTAADEKDQFLFSIKW